MNTEITRDNNLIISSDNQSVTLSPQEVVQLADYLAEHRWRFNETSANDANWTQEELDIHDTLDEQEDYYEQD
jgi:uncharacterized FlgJ-related protein